MKTAVAVVAVVLLAATLSALDARQSSPQALFEKALALEEVQGKVTEAIAVYQKVVSESGDKALAAQAQLHIGLCYEKLGLEMARDAYEKVIRNYPGQAAAVAVAQEKLDAILRAASLSKKGAAEVTIRNVPIPPEPPLELNKVSSDGKYLSYVDGNTGDLGVKKLSTGALRLLTTEGKDYSQYAYSPQWSPDSTKLAFSWLRADRILELRTIALDGSPARVLLRANEGEAVEPMDWSPDGKLVLAIAYTKERTRELGLVSAAGGSFRSLKAYRSSNVAPDRGLFSPDGLFVAYSRPTEESVRARDVFLLSADGSRESPLIQHPADDVLLAWLPDGRGILFASDRAGTFDLWTVQLDKGQAQGAPTLVKRALGPITPMGLTRMGAFYYRTPGSFMDVFTASFDPRTGSVAGSPKKEPLPFEGHNRMPDWSPDGKHLAYVSQRPGERKGVLCIYSADTGKVREYRPGKGFGYPRWAPDGQHLYLMAPSFEGRGIYRMDVQSGEVTPFLGAGADESVFSLRASADQKWIVYSQDGKTVDRLIRRNAESGQEHEIERARDLSNVALSPDGSRLAWILKPDEKTRVLKVMEFPDGTPREIQKLTMVDNWNFDLGWSPDGRFIYYFDRAPGTGEWRLRRVAAEGGEAQDLGLTSRYFEQLSVHPDGSRITYSGPPTTSEPPQVWVMENFLPATKR